MNLAGSSHRRGHCPEWSLGNDRDICSVSVLSTLTPKARVGTQQSGHCHKSQGFAPHQQGAVGPTLFSPVRVLTVGQHSAAQVGVPYLPHVHMGRTQCGGQCVGGLASLRASRVLDRECPLAAKRNAAVLVTSGVGGSDPGLMTATSWLAVPASAIECQ